MINREQMMVTREQIEEVASRHPGVDLTLKEKAAIAAGKNFIFDYRFTDKTSGVAARYGRLTKSEVWNSAWSKIAAVEIGEIE